MIHFVVHIIIYSFSLGHKHLCVRFALQNVNRAIPDSLKFYENSDVGSKEFYEGKCFSFSIFITIIIFLSVDDMVSLPPINYLQTQRHNQINSSKILNVFYTQLI